MVPKRMRDFLGLVAGSEVEIELDGTGNGLRVEVPTPRTELERVDGVLVIKRRPTSVPPPTADELRDILEATRDRRL